MADAVRPDEADGAAERVRRGLARSMLVARWLMAPIYIGLLGALLLVAIKFIQKLVQTAPRILVMDSNEAIFAVLTMVDISLVANLLVLVMFSGWENYVGRLNAGTATERLTGLDFSGLKLKLFGSVAAIAAIQLLETFVHIEDVLKADAMWRLFILLGIGLTGVLLAVMDRLGNNGHD